MMKRNLIALALLCILGIALLAPPVSAGLTVAPDGSDTIGSATGKISYIITITDTSLVPPDAISIDVYYLVDYIPIGEFKVENVETSGTPEWTKEVNLYYLNPDWWIVNLTLTPPATVTAGDTVTVTFTGEVNRWCNDKSDPQGDPLGPNTLTAWRSDEPGYLDPSYESRADFSFYIKTRPGPVVSTVSPPETNADGTVIILTFDKPMDDAVDKLAFTYNIVRKIVGEPDQSFNDQPFNIAALNADPTKIDLTPSGEAIAPGDEVTISYTEDTGIVIADDGSVLEMFDSPKIVTNRLPTVNSAETNADGTKVNVTFNKDMDGPSVDAALFTVTVNGVGNEVKGATLNTPDHKIIELSLTTPVAFSTDAVTVTYTPGSITAEDGGVLKAFGPLTVTNKVKPVVTGINPTGGPVAGGTKVTVTGSRFTGATKVMFGAKDILSADFISVTDTEIKVTTPVGSSGGAKVKVTTSGGTSVNEDAVFTYAPAPTVTSISPTTGYNYGPLSVTITGTGFVDGPGFVVTLRRDGYADIITATDVKVKSLEEITCTFPITGAIVGDWKVVVTNPGEQNNIIQMVGLAIANAANNNPSQGDTSSSYGTGKSTAPASVVEPVAPGAPAPEATGVVTAELSINDQGVISQSTELQSADGRASVSIDQGVVALDQITGAPVSSVSIDTLAPSDMPSVPQDNTVSFAGIAYELGPNGAQFSPAISITFAAPSGQVGQDYTVRSYDHASGTWQDLPTTYDPQTGTITAEVSHFCCFAVFTKIVTTTPAIAATPALTPLIPTKIAPPSPTIATTFLGIILWVVNLMISNPILLAGIVILAVGIVFFVWKQRRDRLYPKP